jgi:hypothetical protein
MGFLRTASGLLDSMEKPFPNGTPERKGPGTPSIRQKNPFPKVFRRQKGPSEKPFPNGISEAQNPMRHLPFAKRGASAVARKRSLPDRTRSSPRVNAGADDRQVRWLCPAGPGGLARRVKAGDSLVKRLDQPDRKPATAGDRPTVCFRGRPLYQTVGKTGRTGQLYPSRARPPGPARPTSTLQGICASKRVASKASRLSG